MLPRFEASLGHNLLLTVQKLLSAFPPCSSAGRCDGDVNEAKRDER